MEGAAQVAPGLHAAGVGSLLHCLGPTGSPSDLAFPTGGASQRNKGLLFSGQAANAKGVSAWRSEDVGAEVYVTVQQFDVDVSGRGVLVAQWRILSPGGEKVLKAGSSRLLRQGTPPDAGSSGAVATLSDLVADLSRQLAQELQRTTSGPNSSSGK